MMGALADPQYNEAMVWIDRYQNKMAKKGHEFINKFDKKYKELNISQIFMEEANNEIVEFTKKETSNVLAKVIYTAV